MKGHMYYLAEPKVEKEETGLTGGMYCDVSVKLKSTMSPDKFDISPNRANSRAISSVQ